MNTNERPLPIPGILLRSDGMVLLSSLLILASVALIAVGMSADTSSDVRIAGNRKTIEQSFHLADGAADLGVQVLLDHFDDAVDPEEDYPDPGSTFPLVGGKFYVKYLGMDPQIYADIQGYPENDNEADSVHSNPDVSFALTAPSDSTFTSMDLAIDIDRLGANYVPGSSIEFAGGYEGVGKGAGAGSVAVYYAVQTQANPPTVSPGEAPTLKSEVTTVYRKVSHIVGGSE